MTPSLTPDDPTWFEREVMELLPELYGAALRLARNFADAEDLTAETIVKAWTNRSALGERASFRGWLFRILTNTFISHRRARDARPIHEPLVEEAGDGEGGFSLFDRLHQPFLLWCGNPEQEFLNKLLQEDLERAVDRLPEAFRVVVVLVDVQGFSYREVAEALDVPIGTVRSRLARGRSSLQESLWMHGADAGFVRPER